MLHGIEHLFLGGFGKFNERLRFHIRFHGQGLDKHAHGPRKLRIRPAARRNGKDHLFFAGITLYCLGKGRQEKRIGGHAVIPAKCVNDLSGDSFTILPGIVFFRYFGRRRNYGHGAPASGQGVEICLGLPVCGGLQGFLFVEGHIEGGNRLGK